MDKKYLFWIIAGYLSGSVLYAYWLPRWICGVDIRARSEDGNPGTFNVYQQCGIWLGSMVLLLELGKAYLPVHLALKTLDPGNRAFALVLAAPVFGHAFPLWNHFKGGKSIAASFGALLGLYPLMAPVLILAGCYLIFSLVIVITPHLMRSIVTFFVWNAGCLKVWGPCAINAGCFLISLIVIGKHLEKYQGEKMKIELPVRKLHIRRDHE